MDYAWKIDTPHSKYDEAAPMLTTLQLTGGRLVRGFLYFPSGPAGLLHLVVLRGLNQIIPAEKGSNYALDDCVVPLLPDLDLDQPPYTLDALTWNESTEHNHTLTLSLSLDPWSDPRERRTWLQRLGDRLK